MKAIIVDDESFSAEYLERLCMQLPGLSVEGCFSNAFQALDYLKSTSVDLVFMDIEMPGLSGLDAVRELRGIRPEIAVVFVTGYDQYALEAFRADAVSYLLKPCDAQELAHAVEKAGRMLPAPVPRLRVHTFGQFNVFVDGEPYYFSNTKARELFALLIDRRGEDVSMETAVELLWEGRAYDESAKQLYRKAVIFLNQCSKLTGLDCFVSNRGSCHVIPRKIECDYYRLLAGDLAAAKEYNGEYMSQYSWAEETVAKIEHYLQINR